MITVMVSQNVENNTRIVKFKIQRGQVFPRQLPEFIRNHVPRVHVDFSSAQLNELYIRYPDTMPSSYTAKVMDSIKKQVRSVVFKTTDRNLANFHLKNTSIELDES